MPATSPTATAARVLLAEDDDSIREALRLLLPHYGIEVAAASSVREAIADLAEHPETCVILDLMLLDGSGIDVLRHVREHKLPTRVAVVTGAADPALLREAQALRPDALFEKPVNSTRLAEWVGRC